LKELKKKTGNKNLRELKMPNELLKNKELLKKINELRQKSLRN